MPRVVSAAAGVWRRFEEYEVVRIADKGTDELYIRPKRGSRAMDYDPWQARRDAQAQASSRRKGALPVAGDAPHRELLSLIQEMELSRGADGHIQYSASTAERLLPWCNQYGLLGVLLHRTQLVALAPASGEEEQDVLLHHNGRWERIRATLMEDERRGRRFHHLHLEEGDIEIPEDVVVEPLASSGVVLQPLRGGPAVREALGPTWWRFFPDVDYLDREEYRYPLPLSPEFWRAYAEPVGEFLDGALALLEGVQALNGRRTVARGQRAAPPDPSFLQSLLAPVRPELTLRSDGKIEQAWRCTSLLGHLAMMAAEDLMTGRVLTCARPGCGNTFISEQWQQLYCSPRCATSARQRRFRTKQTARTRKARGR